MFQSDTLAVFSFCTNWGLTWHSFFFFHFKLWPSFWTVIQTQYSDCLNLQYNWNLLLTSTDSQNSPNTARLCPIFLFIPVIFRCLPFFLNTQTHTQHLSLFVIVLFYHFCRLRPLYCRYATCCLCVFLFINFDDKFHPWVTRPSSQCWERSVHLSLDSVDVNVPFKYNGLGKHFLLERARSHAEREMGGERKWVFVFVPFGYHRDIENKAFPAVFLTCKPVVFLLLLYHL